MLQKAKGVNLKKADWKFFSRKTGYSEIIAM